MGELFEFSGVSEEMMRRKEALKTIIFISIFLTILTTITYIIRTNGEVKDIFNGFYAEKDDTLDVILIGSSPVYPFYSAPKLWENMESPAIRCQAMCSVQVRHYLCLRKPVKPKNPRWQYLKCECLLWKMGIWKVIWHMQEG